MQQADYPKPVHMDIENPSPHLVGERKILGNHIMAVFGQIQNHHGKQEKIGDQNADQTHAALAFPVHHQQEYRQYKDGHNQKMHLFSPLVSFHYNINSKKESAILHNKQFSFGVDKKSSYFHKKLCVTLFIEKHPSFS